ncbi:MAG: hypothetical protein K8R54_04690 [Bacteroidales bacterium]|nr:hypothetical protein [Bacteroidales bacterium]
MKKINLLIIFVLAGTIGFMTSCKNDPEDFAAPTITFTVGEQTVDEGDQVSIVFKVTTLAELAKVRLYKDGAEYGDVITEFTNKQEYSFNEVVDTTATATFTFKVSAEDNQESSKLNDMTVTVTVTPASSGTLTEYTVELGDQNENEGSFIDLETSTIYFVNDCEASAADIDLMYYWGNDGNSSIYSPQGAVDAGFNNYGNIGNWSVLNTTKLKSDDDADYDNATYASVAEGIGSSTEQGITQITEGNLIYFKTDAGRCGIMKIGTVEEGKKGILTISFSYKIQDAESTK